MEILRDYKSCREGNDCLLSDYIVLIKLDTSLYIVTHTDTVYGSWTGDPKTSRSEVFTDYTSAYKYMKRLIKEL